MSIKDRLEARLADEMGYAYCSLFPRARDAIRLWGELTGSYIPAPSNICHELYATGYVRINPVNEENGLFDGSPIQLYGFRNILGPSQIEIDPLMTGWMGQPFAISTIISFGYGKTIDLGAGGAFLTQDKSLARSMRKYSYFPRGLEFPLWRALEALPETIKHKREHEGIWNRALGNLGIRITLKPVIPWRHIRRFPRKRDQIVWNLRALGFNAGTNYPPLAGYHEPSSVKWGREVINLWADNKEDIWRMVKIVRKTLEE